MTTCPAPRAEEPCLPGRRRLALALAAAGLLTLAGCSTLGERAVGVRLRSGRFAGVFVQDGRRENASGRWRLETGPQQTLLDLMTPLYGILARVRITARGAEIEKNGSVIATAPTAEELLERHLGLALPVALLEHWLDGRPGDQEPFRRTGSDAFEQSGWRVAVLRRHASGAAALVRLTALAGAFAGSDVRLTIDAD